MFRLTGSDLPTEKTTSIKPVPIMRLWQGAKRGLAPIALINRVQLNNETISGNLPTPFAIVNYQSFDLGVTIDSVTIPNFIDVSNNPQLRKTLNCFWINGTKLHLIHNSFPSVIDLVVSINLVSTEGLTIPENFTVDKIQANGLTFHPGTGLGQFQQTANQITITTSPQYRLLVGDALEITGKLNLISGTSILVVAFSIPDIDDLAAIDWLGTSFIACDDVYNPAVNEFFWSNNIAYLFTDKKNLPQAYSHEVEAGSALSGQSTFDQDQGRSTIGSIPIN